MIDFQLAPFIIAGLLVVTGYMFTRWLSNLGELRQWKRIAHDIDASAIEQIEAMRAEGCAAMGALQSIFNGVTASGMPHSKLVWKVADVATNALVLCAPCEHKEDAEDLVLIVENLEGEIGAARLCIENWQNLAVEAEVRMEESERLLGLANDRLIVLQSEREPTPLPYERGDVPEADD